MLQALTLRVILRVCLFVCQDLAIFLLIFVEVVLYTFLIYDIRRRLQHTLLIISPILRANFVGENAQNLKICTFCYHILQVFHKKFSPKIVRALLFYFLPIYPNSKEAENES